MWLNNDCFNPYRDPQHTPPISHCAHCRVEIYGEDKCYLVNSEVICADCLEDFEKETRSSMTGHDLDTYLHQLYGGLNDVD